ncbi:uncharacterized protein NEMAJ01_2338 [Nematocida major]|uniref:uncharacterized protein n=1 Tax=Nematocida major TaxID=1912982 RepID=UPI002008AE3F|nr:uncharacterized protein NEMAJ01_2338 [Nematocida major]KAH9387442.1 hypothetical protein NEMAJ01_2338 [Nematocida major]
MHPLSLPLSSPALPPSLPARMNQCFFLSPSPLPLSTPRVPSSPSLPARLLSHARATLPDRQHSPRHHSGPTCALANKNNTPARVRPRLSFFFFLFSFLPTALLPHRPIAPPPEYRPTDRLQTFPPLPPELSPLQTHSAPPSAEHRAPSTNKPTRVYHPLSLLFSACVCE